MQCTSPTRLSEYMLVPCGKCANCIISRSREWATRIIHELPYHNSSIFITLSYRDECLPEKGVNSEHYTNFIKRLRKKYYPRKIKYFACAEYGEKTFRPHYHAVIFGMSIFDDFVYYMSTSKGKLYLHPCWDYGHIHVGAVTYESARYVAGYIGKKKTNSPGLQFNKPFQRQSQGIGYQWFKDNKDRISKTGKIKIKDKEIGIPRYYQKKMDIDSHRKYIERLVKSNKRARDIKKKFPALDNPEKLHNFIKHGVRQEIINRKAKKVLYGEKERNTFDAVGVELRSEAEDYN